MQVAGHIRLLKHFYFKPEDQISSLYAIHVQGSPLTVLPHGICPLLPLHESTVAEACPTQLTGGRWPPWRVESLDLHPQYQNYMYDKVR